MTNPTDARAYLAAMFQFPTDEQEAEFNARVDAVVAEETAANPDTEDSQDHPGAELFHWLRKAGLAPDAAQQRIYAYAAMVLRQEKTFAADTKGATL